MSDNIGFFPGSIEDKLDDYRCLVVTDDKNTEYAEFPFSVHEREVKEANSFDAFAWDLYRWCRDNLTNPWAIKMEHVEIQIVLNGKDESVPFMCVIYMFQTLEDATHFRLRF